MDCFTSINDVVVFFCSTGYKNRIELSASKDNLQEEEEQEQEAAKQTRKMNKAKQATKEEATEQLYMSKDDRDYNKALIRYASAIQQINLRRKKRNLPPLDLPSHLLVNRDNEVKGDKRNRPVRTGRAARKRNLEKVIQRLKNKRENTRQEKVSHVYSS